jgi:hypothetical protein
MSRTSPLAGRRPASRNGSATFSSAVSDGSKLNDWKTKPIRSRRSLVSFASLSPPSACPASRISPDVGRSSPAAHCSKVLLPEPDGPITAVKVPGAKSAVTSRKAVTAPPPDPYTFVTARSATAGSEF